MKGVLETCLTRILSDRQTSQYQQERMRNHLETHRPDFLRNIPSLSKGIERSSENERKPVDRGFSLLIKTTHHCDKQLFKSLTLMISWQQRESLTTEYENLVQNIG